MSKVASLSRQHGEILARIGLIKNMLQEKELAEREGAKKVRKILSELAGMLKMHMLREDDFLYPELLNSPDERLRTVAKKFIQEMGGLADQFQEYNQKYLLYTKIQENVQEFMGETVVISRQLERRIEKEEHKLYNLL